jgi:hypothetical protein
MDTKKDSELCDVPTFTVVRVGKDRKRKGGAFAFLRGGGARGSFSGATGGAGAGGASGFFASSFVKTMLSIMMASGIGSAAMYAGTLSNSAAKRAVKPAAKPAVFQAKADVKIEGDTSNLPSNANTIPNSMGYVSGSVDGLTAEERAQKAATAAEAERLAAAEEAKRKAEEEATAKAAEEATAKAAAVDPNALLAAAQADGKSKGEDKSAFGTKFGALSSSTGGSALSGGSGLSGGVGRSFGGMGNIGKGEKGSLSGARAAAARPTTGRAANRTVAKSNAKGFARKQLENVNAQSRQAITSGPGESTSYAAGAGFENTKPAGTVISGAGIGTGAKPSGGGSGSGDGSVNPTTTSNVVNSERKECGTDKFQDPESGQCKDIPNVNNNNIKDATKNRWMYKTAVGILIALTVLSGIAAASWAFPGGGQAVRAYIMVAMKVLAGILTALGAAILLTTGDKIAGGIITVIGAITLYKSLSAPETTTGEAVKELGIKQTDALLHNNAPDAFFA